MGVDFYTCKGCDEVHNDCERVYHCCECGTAFCETCGDTQGKKYGLYEETGEVKQCDECNDDEVEKRELAELTRLKEKYNDT